MPGARWSLWTARSARFFLPNAEYFIGNAVCEIFGQARHRLVFGQAEVVFARDGIACKGAGVGAEVAGFDEVFGGAWIKKRDSGFEDEIKAEGKFAVFTAANRTITAVISKVDLEDGIRLGGLAHQADAPVADQDLPDLGAEARLRLRRGAVVGCRLNVDCFEGWRGTAPFIMTAPAQKK